jgi:hypothetical protein
MTTLAPNSRVKQTNGAIVRGAMEDRNASRSSRLAEFAALCAVCSLHEWR